MRRGCKVRIRSEDDEAMYRVESIKAGSATIWSLDRRTRSLGCHARRLVVVREFGDPIYPGLKSTGRVDRGGTSRRTSSSTPRTSTRWRPCSTRTRARSTPSTSTRRTTPARRTGSTTTTTSTPSTATGTASGSHSWNAADLAKRLLKPDALRADRDDRREGGELASGCSSSRSSRDSRHPDGHYRSSTPRQRPAGGFSRVDEYLFFVAMGSAQLRVEPDEESGRRPHASVAYLRRTENVRPRHRQERAEPVLSDLRRTSRQIASRRRSAPSSVDPSVKAPERGCPPSSQSGRKRR